MQNRLDPFAVKAAARIEDRQRQNQLAQRKSKRMVHRVKKGRKRQAHHMAHGDIEQRRRENNRQKKAAADAVRPLGSAFLFRLHIPFCLHLQGGIARLRHGELNVGDAHLCRVKRNGCPVGGNAHARLLHPVKPMNRLLHRPRAGRAGHAVYGQENRLKGLIGIFLFAHLLEPPFGNGFYEKMLDVSVSAFLGKIQSSQG